MSCAAGAANITFNRLSRKLLLFFITYYLLATMLTRGRWISWKINLHFYTIMNRISFRRFPTNSSVQEPRRNNAPEQRRQFSILLFYRFKNVSWRIYIRTGMAIPREWKKFKSEGTLVTLRNTRNKELWGKHFKHKFHIPISVNSFNVSLLSTVENFNECILESY